MTKPSRRSSPEEPALDKASRLATGTQPADRSPPASDGLIVEAAQKGGLPAALLDRRGLGVLVNLGSPASFP